MRHAAAHLLVESLVVPELEPSADHHLRRVLRVPAGRTVTVTDGRGSWRACAVTDSGLESLGPVVAEPASDDPFTLYCAIPKHDRPEWIVQKATELGADRIVWLHAQRSVVRWDSERTTRHLERLRRIAVEAMLQSRRVRAPELDGPIAAAEVLARDQVVVAEPGGRTLRPGDRQIAVGPEGGWSEDEVRLARDLVGLGADVLRVETAAIVACVHGAMRGWS